MTAPSRFKTDDDFEAELRAMLERRATDIGASRPAAGRLMDRPLTDAATEVSCAGAAVGSVSLVVPPGRPRDGRRRRVARLAAALALVAGAAGLMTVVARGGHGTTETGSNPADQTTLIWPLGETIPADQLATPESATRAYLAEVIGTSGDLQLNRTDVRGTEATVHYMLGGTPAAVTLTQRDGSWFVTGATNELVVINHVRAPHDTRVDVEVTPGRLAAPVQRLRARLVDSTGQVYDTAEVEFENGKPVENPGPPLADGSWHTYLYVGETTEAVAVRVDVLSSDVENDPALAHASVAVPGAANIKEIGPAASATTTAPPITVDPNPQPMPPGPDRIPALWTEGEPSAAGPGSTHSLDGWQPAATALLNTVIDHESPTGPPTFTNASIDGDELTVQGRYSLPDGDTGVFELAKLEDGTWAMTSLRSDALEIVDVGRTGSRVQVTLMSTKDADLGAGGFRVGLAPGEPWVSAGRAAVFSVPCNDNSAMLFQFLDAHDGTNIRIAEAWPC
jgi:hypothetical protein